VELTSKLTSSWYTIKGRVVFWFVVAIVFKFLVIDNLTGNELVFGENLLWMVFAAPVSIVYLCKLWTALGTHAFWSLWWAIDKGTVGSGDKIAMGIIQVSLGGCIHRYGWLEWRYWKGFKETFPEQYLQLLWNPVKEIPADISILSLPSICLICHGYVFHIYPWLNNTLKNTWAAIAICVVTFVFIVSELIVPG
jgi:hypothetical protein